MLDLSNERTNIKLADVKQGQYFCFCVEEPDLADLPEHDFTNNAGKEVDNSSIFLMIEIPGYLKVKQKVHLQDDSIVSKESFKKHRFYINIHTMNVHHCHGDEYVYVVDGVNITVPV